MLAGGLASAQTLTDYIITVVVLHDILDELGPDADRGGVGLDDLAAYDFISEFGNTHESDRRGERGRLDETLAWDLGAFLDGHVEEGALIILDHDGSTEVSRILLDAPDDMGLQVLMLAVDHNEIMLVAALSGSLAGDFDMLDVYSSLDMDRWLAGSTPLLEDAELGVVLMDDDGTEIMRFSPIDAEEARYRNNDEFLR